MTKRLRPFLLTMLLSAATLLSVRSASADTILFSLANPSQTGAAGSTLSFAGTVAFTGSTTGVYLDDSFTFNPLTAVADNGYFNNIFPVLFVSGYSVTGPLFTVTLPSNLVSGIYKGTFTLFEDNDSTVTNTQNFQVTIPAAASPVPEPGTWLLLSTGLTAFVAFSLYKRNESALQR